MKFIINNQKPIKYQIINEEIFEYMNIKENELPTLRIADSSGEYLKKYKMEGELNEDNIIVMLIWKKMD